MKSKQNTSNSNHEFGERDMSLKSEEQDTSKKQPAQSIEPQNEESHDGLARHVKSGKLKDKPKNELVKSKEGGEQPDEDKVDSLAVILERINHISHQLEELKKGFDTKLKYDKNKEEIIQHQRVELKKYQQGLHYKILRPIIMDLIAMHDDMSDIIKYESQRDVIDESEKRMIRNLESFKESVESILEHQGISNYRAESDLFDAKRQRARRVIKTSDKDLGGKIAERLRKGFVYEDKNIRPEVVAVYKYEEAE